jgi:hypothetical protein
MSVHGLARRIHQTASDHGFWDFNRNFGEMISLMHSELSEALEEHRAGRPDVWARCSECGELRTLDDWPVNPRFGWICHGLPLKPEGAAIELADAIIRELDTLWKMAESQPYTIDQIIELKMAYNNTREHKHGKAY